MIIPSLIMRVRVHCASPKKLRCDFGTHYFIFLSHCQRINEAIKRGIYIK
jgi:hypothetical protein